MNILIACEESQAITIEMRKRGHNCFSADLQECSGGHPEWHINGDCLPLLNGNCEFVTQDGAKHRIEGKWDMIIAHPPCTYLTNVATRHHSLSYTPLDKINKRTEKRIEAMKFFMTVVNADCDKIAVENPVGVMNTCYRKPDQTIHPYMFAESENDKENYVTKATCLWLKGLEPLKRKEIEKTDNSCLFGSTSDVLPPPDNSILFGSWINKDGKKKNHCWENCQQGNKAKVRSKTFPGIAKAIAEQWG